MDKNINLVEILKDCPRGIKLYSTVYGEVEFIRIRTGIIYPIECEIIKDKTNCIFTKEGKILSFYDNECTLFPSKEQRDWSKFKVKPEMIDGEFYYCCYSQNFKENSFIFIYKKHLLYKTKFYAAVNIFHSILFTESAITNNNEIITELRKATEEEKQRLLYAIEKENYKWDNEKKELVKIEPKFNVNTLQPFDKVLVRDWNNSAWRCTFYECFKRGNPYPFITMNGVCKQCIPYNEDTKHLVNTTKMSPKKYITWEE